ncbi:hypothetical protein BDA96_01G159400 [Sorghum bicolor]|uniref:Uncharacterized protein n=1 Tax=Sorghum bicolor TaxID=4558 RepID=A0A921V0A5_SORBI|nr:hypothetical protein BDA96_01G159400 [Sorghum bicolor]
MQSHGTAKQWITNLQLLVLAKEITASRTCLTVSLELICRICYGVLSTMDYQPSE